MEVRRPDTPSHTSLMLACQQELKTDVQVLLHRQPGAALQRDRSGKNALHYCAENSSAECASRLLSAAPALLDAQDEEGYSPLHLAVISGNRTMVKYLLGKGADLTAVDSEKHTCVHWATVCGEAECLDLLIRAGAEPSTPDIHGAFPVHYAAQMCGPNCDLGNDVRQGLAVLRKLISRGADVAVVDHDGRQPLLWAASAGSSDAILALVNAGADVNAEDKDGLTALHCAASRGHLDCLETLITLCGAELDKTDVNGCSALFYAVTLGHADCTNLLLGFGAQPNRQDRKGRTPAHCGASKGQMETLKILAQHSANLWLRNARGDMPLHEAVQSGRKDLVEWLLNQHQGSVNVSNSNGRTPLHIAAITNNVDMCKILMDYGAFINPIMRNSKGQHLTPLDAALHRGNRGCAKYLNLHGALPAGKLLEKRECNRFTETHPSDTLELSPNTRRRVVRDSSAQTEAPLREVDVQQPFDRHKTIQPVAARTSPEYGTKSRCPQQAGPGKPIIAKVYVHTKRTTRTKRVTRKPTAYRKDCQGEKVSGAVTSQQQRNVGGLCVPNVQTETAPQTEDSQRMPQRQVSMLEQERLDRSLPDVTVQSTPDEEEVAEQQMTTDDDTVRDDSKTDQEELERSIVKNLVHGHINEQLCGCYTQHREDEMCQCICHQEHLLTVKDARRDTLKESDLENQSPLSSIRSLESTVKDSGFSDDVDRGQLDEASSEDEEDVITRRKHIARYIVSSGAAETFRLDEDDEDEVNDGSVTPRSYSMPHLGKKEEMSNTCPRLLNRPTLSKEVQRSLKKYQMERRLFYELQELKRKQICGIRENEKDIIAKIVERFREHVLSPMMSDFQGPFTFRAFERYLYEQLRKLSMGGKIPKLKTESKILPARTYVSPTGPRDVQSTHALCTCELRQCHPVGPRNGNFNSDHKGSDGDPRTPCLPQIVRAVPGTRGQQSRIPVIRSKSWDRLDGGRRKSSALPALRTLREHCPASRSLPALSNPFPRKIPASLLAAICERLGADVHPDDTVVVEMTAEDVPSKMRHAFTVREIREAVSRYEQEAGRKVRPVALESVLDPDDDGPITFEIRHGKEKNVFRLPANKLKDNKKWFLHYCLWPVGRYVFPSGEGELPLDPNDFRWNEIELSTKTVLKLPPDFWT